MRRLSSPRTLSNDIVRHGRAERFATAIARRGSIGGRPLFVAGELVNRCGRFGRQAHWRCRGVKARSRLRFRQLEPAGFGWARRQGRGKPRPEWR